MVGKLALPPVTRWSRSQNLQWRTRGGVARACRRVKARSGTPGQRRSVADVQPLMLGAVYPCMESRSKQWNRRAHSLVEIIVVIAIIVVLAALTLGVIVAAKKIVNSLKAKAEGSRAEAPAMVDSLA